MDHSIGYYLQRNRVVYRSWCFQEVYFGRFQKLIKIESNRLPKFQLLNLLKVQEFIPCLTGISKQKWDPE